MNATPYGEGFSSSADVSGASGAASNYNVSKEASQAISNGFKFAASKSIRTSTMILASFNALAAFATAMGIIYGCYTYKRRAIRRSSDAPSGLFFIHTVEVYPLVLSFGITIQSIIFAAAQSIGLKALLSSGCTVVAIFTLPALFIAPYIHLVFGVETAARGLRSQFSPRRRWTVAICLGTISTFLLATLLVAAISRAPDFCFASLLWIVKPYAKGIFAVFLGVSVVLLLVIITIFVKLSKGRMVDPTERMAASRMIYYLILGFISNGFIIPFFFSLTFLTEKKQIFQELNLSMVASVVANVNGLMVAGLHLFLRSQNNASIGHNLGEYEHHKTKFEPHEEDAGSTHALHPVNSTNDQNRVRSDSITTLLRAVDAEEGQSPSSPTFRPKVTIPQAPEPTQAPSETSPSHLRKQSYSLFPNNPFAPAAVLPATTYAPAASKPLRDTFRPPPIVKPWLGRGHKRDSSIVSSATVQIGIRFSNVDDFQPARASDVQESERPETVLRPSPLAQSEVRPESEDARMKTLPPVPKGESPVQKVESDEEQSDSERSEGSDQDGLITLSSSVYTPQETPQRNTSTKTTRMPSPMGVGFSNPAARNNGEKHAPPRPNAGTATTPVPSNKSWI
ncbi:hypothetical protein INS49_014825 [Diaporthe citri]|uniref:uncharacterized protein n=1 Tax=Diaporthe citri TaxID=83186 RepID=UPI001C81D3D6|nr:uncharacterized protein INS49_014825 [Diaporthe citri]KAG6356950.1 hypothetical protein INS49_014825 [Diaporthe citri]